MAMPCSSPAQTYLRLSNQGDQRMPGQAFKKDPLLPIGEITKRSGVAASALRYYESLGLISSSRQGSSRRFFPRSTLRRVAFIIFAQKIGYSLDEIGKQLARLPTDKLPTNDDWQALSRGWKQRRAAHQRTATTRHGSGPLHRLWLPLAAALQARQSERLGRQWRYGTAAVAIG